MSIDIQNKLCVGWMYSLPKWLILFTINLFTQIEKIRAFSIKLLSNSYAKFWQGNVFSSYNLHLTSLRSLINTYHIYFLLRFYKKASVPIISTHTNIKYVLLSIRKLHVHTFFTLYINSSDTKPIEPKIWTHSQPIIKKIKT